MSLTLFRMADKLYKLLSVCYTNGRPKIMQKFLSFKITPQDHKYYCKMK